MHPFPQVNSQLLVNVNSYVLKMMNMFGVSIGDQSGGSDQVSGKDLSLVLMAWKELLVVPFTQVYLE